jgi:hypothetical protein
MTNDAVAIVMLTRARTGSGTVLQGEKLGVHDVFFDPGAMFCSLRGLFPQKNPFR